MKTNFLNFIASITDPQCPWDKALISTYTSMVEVVFVTSGSINQSNIVWLNNQLMGGEWFIMSDENKIKIVVRFHYEDK